MRILFIGAYSDKDIVLAPIKVGRELFKNFFFQGVGNVYLCYFDDGSNYNRIQKLFGFEKVNERVFRSGIFPILLFIIKFKPSHIQITTPDAFYLPIFFLKPILKFKIAYLSHSIISYSLKNFLNLNCYHKLRFRIIEKIVLKYSDIIEVLSRIEAGFSIRYLKVKFDKIRIVDNGINPSGIIKKYCDKTDVIRIIFVGSIFRKEKSFELLLDALSRLTNIIILSVYNYEEQRKENLNIPKNIIVIFGAPLTEIELRKEFCNNDLFVIPSKRDSFPLSLLEAMDTGILFISSDRVGLTERFPESFKRFVLPYGEPDKLKDKILELHSLDNVEKNKLSENIRKFSSQYNWSKIVQNYLKFLS